MTQEATPVGGEATPAAETNPADVFTQLAAEEFGVTDEQEEEQPAEGEPVEGEAEGADDEPGIEEEADELPPIDAPVSWDAEAKAKFAELPRELQETVTKRETERERFVQQKSQEAAQARQTVAQQAQSELAQYDAQMAQQYQQLAAQLAPQAPDPSLLRINPEAFYAQEADYRAKTAQQQQLQQQAQGLAQQAQYRAAQVAQAEQAEQHRIIVDSFPEYADPTTGPELRSKLTAVAKELGYPDELIQQARASDILAMRKVADLKSKADKYDALMSKKMANVRAARGKPPVTARPGVSQGSEQLRARTAQAALDTALTSRNRDVQGAAFFDYLQKTGQVK
jgi:hypothetical protein